MSEPQSVLLLSLVFLGAAVIAVPVFRFAGLSAVLGYFAAGVAIGPSGFGLFTDATALRTFAELGVVMFLFVIGLELKPSKLLSMRRDILFYGIAQMVFSGVLIAPVLWFFGFKGAALFAVAFAFALSATAIALQIIEERGAMGSAYGQKSFAVLLFQDIAVVPFVAILPLFALTQSKASSGSFWSHLDEIGIAVAAVLALVLAGKFLLNPFFRLLAKADAREIMTAAALLLVLGSAELMHKAGLSAALGAFIAGLMLAESHFRHQLEADIEPFRGLLLGLFFMSVGMGLDAAIIRANLPVILGGAIGLMVLKIGLVFALLRAGKLGFSDSVRGAVLLSPVGEFAFVILPLAASIGLLAGKTATILSAIAALTMFFGPVLAKFAEPALAWRKKRRGGEPTMEENYDDADGEVLVIGFGRFGQVVNQMFLAAERNVTVIDRNIDQIKTAARFGFKVYYGDGRRLDVLRAAGAERASVIAVCVDDREAASAIAEMARRTFPSAKLIARAYDRTHALDLMERGVRAPFRETFDTALAFGREALVALGIPDDEADELRDDVRRRDIQRLNRQRDEGLFAGMDLLHGVKVTPEPLIAPRREGKDITKKAQDEFREQQAREGVTGESS
ncbi:MAG: monovalent cation:proton antiporter-2 (CPA2) family protein [Beijerinckiaceae bacterium]|jgi:monovalent cation:proton antiporter-2 (CPA2) family protein|nr:monovalent cation:proton antiporter-2 (CPA2) family protein [Beijerinckiaceae bacterium]